MAACGHATCNDCYNSTHPQAAKWRTKCPQCFAPSLRCEQLYRPVATPMEVLTDDSDGEGPLQPVGFVALQPAAEIGRAHV